MTICYIFRIELSLVPRREALIPVDSDFVKEQAFTFSFSSSFRLPRSVTRRRFWILTALLKVGDILNILMLNKMNFGSE